MGRVMPSEFSKLPLRERLTIAERLARELSEHLEQGFLPRIETLRRVTRQKGAIAEETTDKTVRDTVSLVQESEQFTAELYEKVQSCLDSIADEVSKMVHGNESEL